MRKEHQIEFLEALLSPAYRACGFKYKDLKQILGKNRKTAKITYELHKLRERDAVKKLQNTHYYRLTKEGYILNFFLIF